ncbi:MAG TPA: autotransporter-associated beta strand repeat-containing protein [Chthoniobacteraceae bacterium]|nr:autotransporter-associated beta strand repeat-containing protein [Chthoniobacteraceae bacterium]
MMNPLSLFCYLGRATGLALCLHAMTARPVLAVDGSWKPGASSGDWSDSAKWNGEPDPVPGGIGSTVTIEAPDLVGHITITLDGDRTVGTLRLGGPSSRDISGASTLTFDNGASPAEIRMISGSAGTLRLYNITSIALNSSLLVGGEAARTVLFTNTTISGAGGITKTGEGTLVFDTGVTGTYTGGFTLDGGNVRVENNTAFGTGTLVLRSGTVERTSGGGARFLANAFTLDGNVTVNNNTSSQTTFSGAGTLTGNRTLTVEGTNPVTFSGGLGDGGNGYGLTKAGSGTLTISTVAASYTGATVVDSGTLQFGPTAAGNINSSSSLTINNGGTVLQGALSHRVGDTASVTINTGGTWNMSTLFDTVGAFTLNGGSLTGGATGRLTASSYDIRSGLIDKTLNNNDAALTKTTGGTATLSQAALYTGATTVNEGTLVITGAGTINATSAIALNGGVLRYESATALNRAVTLDGGSFAYDAENNYTGTLTFTSGTLAGTNWAGSLRGLVIGADRTISPGNSPGTAGTTNQTWAGGGTYLWEINDATGSAGADPGWDLLNGTGTLTLTATELDRFTIRIASLTLGNDAGEAAHFDASLNYQWMIADFGNALAFDPLAFQIDTSLFANAFTGAFTLHRGDEIAGADETQLWLVYAAAIPEPSTWALLVAALLLLPAAGKMGRRRPL